MFEVRRSAWSSDGEPEDLAARSGDRARLGRVAKLLIAARQARAEHLPPSSVGEPAWDILLVLYAAYADQARLKIGAATCASGVPQTTAIRWIDHLVREGLINRTPVSWDKRCLIVELSPKGVTLMERLLHHQIEILRGLMTI